MTVKMLNLKMKPMSNDLHTFIQLLVVAGWIVIFLYSFFRKFDYLCTAQKLMIPFVCVGFSILNTTLFNAVVFKTDWYSVLFYLCQIITQLLFAVSFHRKEIRIDKLKNDE